jgi:amino acid adenylation domain-containing protein
MEEMKAVREVEVTTPSSSQADRRSPAAHRIFENQAERTPASTAIIWDGGALTYRELNARANQLARYLRARGVTRETLVGVCLRRSAETVIAFLAVLKAGGAYVPLDPDYPRERVAFMITDTGTPLIVTDRACASVLPPHQAAIVNLDEAVETIGKEDQTNLNLDAAVADLIYVMYTSGSTGRPKGVLIEHRAVVRLVCGADYAAFDETQRFMLLAPSSFDASTFEIWGPLLNGGSLAIAPVSTPSLEEIGNLISRFGVTTLWLTAGLFNLMVDQNVEGLRPLRQLLAGGDALSVAHCRRALAALPGCRLINGYGPTETTTFAICATITADALQGAAVPIGLPINQTEIYLVGRDLNPVAQGEVGEICIGGLGVARGYLNQPELTAEKFVVPHWNTNTRLYRTGDLGRRVRDGVIEFVGRLDDQVKVSGYRVEPNEIACVLREHPQVHDATVSVRKNESGNATLIAYVVSDAAIGRDDLRDFLAGKLPAFMIPTIFVPIQSIPLTSNGKVDRAALLGFASESTAAAPAAAPGTTGAEDVLENQIAAIWCAVLRCAEVDPNVNFFDLGGDSLRLIEVQSRLNRQLGVKISITDLFQFPTVSAIVAGLQAKGAGNQLLSESEERARSQRELLTRRASTRI